MRLIIAGSRDITDLDVLLGHLSVLPPQYEITEIVSGGARGVDQLGEAFARMQELPVKQFLPDWDTYGKAAGHLRNKQMAEYGDILLAIWDGKSKGTKNMVENMLAQAKPIFLHIYDNTLSYS